MSFFLHSIYSSAWLVSFIWLAWRGFAYIALAYFGREMGQIRKELGPEGLDDTSELCGLG